MNMTYVLIFAVVVIATALIVHVLRDNPAQARLIKELTDAKIKPGKTEQLIARKTCWVKQQKLLTDRETRFLLGLLGSVDPDRWYLCPQVRVADVVEISDTIKSKSQTWWKLFRLSAQWHLDVVIVNRNTFEIVAAIELDDRSHLKASRRRRDILLNEVMRQAGIPLLRSYDPQDLKQQVCAFLKTEHRGLSLVDNVLQEPENEPG